MSAKFKIRDVAKSFYTNYLKRAEECLHAAKNSFAMCVFISWASAMLEMNIAML
jgi:hypothetical protein